MKKIEDYCTRFSSFPLFKLEKFRHTIIKSTKTDKVNLIPFEVIFEGRSSITESEMFEFQMTKLLLLITRGKINELEAMYNVLDDLNLSEDYYSYLKTMLILIRLNLLQKYLEKNKIMTYQFKILLKGVSNPKVWRRVVVPANFTFDQFHKVIQMAFGWEFSHLYFFSPTGYNSQPVIEPKFEGDDFYE